MNSNVIQFFRISNGTSRSAPAIGQKVFAADLRSGPAGGEVWEGIILPRVGQLDFLFRVGLLRAHLLFQNGTTHDYLRGRPEPWDSKDIPLSHAAVFPSLKLSKQYYASKMSATAVTEPKK